MIQKILDSLGSVGLILVAIGLIQYSVTNLTDWPVLSALIAGTVCLLVYLVTHLDTVKAVFKSRSARLGGMALASLILVLGIVALLNFLNFRHHKRYDLSEGGVNSISSQTRGVLDGLNQDIQVIGFFQDDQEAERFRAQVSEYAFTSPRVSYEIVDPQREPSKVKQYQVTRNGQVVIQGSDKREVIDNVTEETLTNAILKVTRDVVKVIYFMTGHGERNLEGNDETGYSVAKGEIEKRNYRVETVNLAQMNAVPVDAAALILAGPKQNLFPNEVELLQEYLARGGKLLVMADPQSGFEADAFLEAYGLRLQKDRVVDVSGLGQFYGLGAAAPLAADYADHTITRPLESSMTVYPDASSLAEVESSLGYSTVALVRSSAQSWGESELEASEVSFDEGSDFPGPLVMGALATKSLPAEKAEADDAGPATDATPGEMEPPAAESVQESRLVLFGDSDFASNEYFQLSVNGDLFLNTVSWLAEDADLLSIRPRDPKNRTVPMTETESRLIFLTTVILFPLATLVFGLAVWHRRR